MRWQHCDDFHSVVCSTQVSMMIFLLVVTTITSSPILAQLASNGLNKSTDPLQNSGMIIISSAHYKCQRQGKFYCKNSELCISADRLCDGINDCSSREDEFGCAPASLTKITNASCGSTIYGSGTLLIPDYSEKYGNYFTCNWTLIANPPTEIVTVHIPTMSLESCCTFISYFNGHEVSRRYSGEMLSHLLIFGGMTVVMFTTNRTTAASGLSLGFETMLTTYSRDVTPPCGSTIYESGDVLSPNYPGNYSNFLSCNWTLISSPSYDRIFLQVLSFNTESCCDVLSIYNRSTLTHRFSGTVAPTNMVLDNVTFISFTTDGSSVASGFHLWFSTIVTTTVSPVDACKRRGYFYCASSDQCVEPRHRCDGNSYCYHGEDEAGCISSSTTHLRYSNAYLFLGYVLVRVNFR